MKFPTVKVCGNTDPKIIKLCIELGASLIGFIIIVLGGLGHPVGALIAGVLFGLVEQIATVFLPQAAAQMLGFIILITVIFFRPQGLMGRMTLR